MSACSSGHSNSVNTNNNNETFKLLDVTSDSEPELLQLELPARKRKIYRTRRNRNHEPPPLTSCQQWAPRAVTIAIGIVLVAWLIALSWVAASLYADTKRLDAFLRQASMESKRVGDDLDKCHSAARELQHNHSEMAVKLDELYIKTENLSQQVFAIQSSLSTVKKQVASAPELTFMPQQLSDMKDSVARFGSQIKDLGSTVSSLRTQTGSLVDGQNILVYNITDVNSEIVKLWNKTNLITNHSSLKDLEPVIKKQEELQNSISQLNTNITFINETLSTQIKWATQDFKDDHRNVIGLLESVQNHSAAVSNLQTAWRQNNEIISRNITEIQQKIIDKEAEIQRQRLEIKELQKFANEMNSQKTIVPQTNLPENPPSDVKALHERDSENIFTMPKLLISSTPSPLDILKRTDAPKPVTGKPNILSSSGSA